MEAPQSEAELAPFLTQLRAIDPYLSIEWNPAAYVTSIGRFDCYGNVVPPRSAPRWEVWRVDPRTGERQRLHVVTLDGKSYGDYMPIDQRIVERFKVWDAANAAYIERRKQEEAQNDKIIAERGGTPEDIGLFRQWLEKKATDEFHLKPALGRGFGVGPRRR
jgi:hypothetical protein